MVRKTSNLLSKTSSPKFSSTTWSSTRWPLAQRQMANLNIWRQSLEERDISFPITEAGQPQHWIRLSWNPSHHKRILICNQCRFFVLFRIKLLIHEINWVNAEYGVSKETFFGSSTFQIHSKKCIGTHYFCRQFLMIPG